MFLASYIISFLSLTSSSLCWRNCGLLPLRDYRYYLNALEEAKYQVDHEALREYFPFDTVLEGMLSIYRDAFGLQFTELKDTETWHPDVLVFQVSEKKK